MVDVFISYILNILLVIFIICIVIGIPGCHKIFKIIN
jgi:hypothetical protein